MDEIDKTFSPWQLVQHTLSSYSNFHFQFVEAGSITLSHFHHTLTFTLSPSARGSWSNQIPITAVTNIIQTWYPCHSVKKLVQPNPHHQHHPMHPPHCKTCYPCHSVKQLVHFHFPKQVTSEWGSYLRSYKLEQDIFPGSQITSALLHSVSLISGWRDR